MISIIVPVYNAEDYLHEAILSVFSQTYKDWELILVDDGSTDSSPEICDKAALCSNNVVVRHIANKGVSHARNIGLELAKGEFFTFIDADDILDSHALEIMVNVSICEGADIVCVGIKEFNGEKDFTSILHSKYTKDNVKLLSPVNAAVCSLYQRVVDNSVWGKLYASHIWTNLRFKEGLRYEDLEICYKLFLKSTKVAVTDQTLYYYRQHSGSYIHTFTTGRADALIVTEEIVRNVGKSFPKLLPAAKSRQLSANFNILGLIAANGMDHAKEVSNIANMCWEKIKELRSEVLRNPNVRLKNKIGIMVSYLFGRKGVETLSKLVYKD